MKINVEFLKEILEYSEISNIKNIDQVKYKIIKNKIIQVRLISTDSKTENYEIDLCRIAFICKNWAFSKNIVIEDYPISLKNKEFTAKILYSFAYPEKVYKTKVYSDSLEKAVIKLSELIFQEINLDNINIKILHKKLTDFVFNRFKNIQALENKISNLVDFPITLKNIKKELLDCDYAVYFDVPENQGEIIINFLESNLDHSIFITNIDMIKTKINDKG